jgi:hypothetical protein
MTSLTMLFIITVAIIGVYAAVPVQYAGATTKDNRH